MPSFLTQIYSLAMLLLMIMTVALPFMSDASASSFHIFLLASPLLMPPPPSFLHLSQVVVAQDPLTPDGDGNPINGAPKHCCWPQLRALQTTHTLHDAPATTRAFLLFSFCSPFVFLLFSSPSANIQVSRRHALSQRTIAQLETTIPSAIRLELVATLALPAQRRDDTDVDCASFKALRSTRIFRVFQTMSPHAGRMFTLRMLP